jgi:hypothetical protein
MSKGMSKGMSQGMSPKEKQASQVGKATVHPETQKAGKAAGVPGEESSKAPAGARPDARTGHDKDGNAVQTAQGAGKPGAGQKR